MPDRRRRLIFNPEVLSAALLAWALVLVILLLIF